MVYLKIAYDMFVKKFLFHLILIIELALTLILINVFVGIFGNQNTLYRPYKDFISNDGVVYMFNEEAAFDDETGEEKTEAEAISYFKEKLGRDADIIYMETLDLYEDSDVLPKSFLPRDSEVQILMPDKRVLSELRLPLAHGRWFSLEKDKDGCIEAVISGGTDAVVGNVYETSAGKIKIVGILSDNSYLLPSINSIGDFSGKDNISVNDLYGAFDSNVNVMGTFMLINRELIPSESKGKGFSIYTDPLMFISYGKDLSSKEIEEKNNIVCSFLPGDLSSQDILLSFSQLRQNTGNYLAELMMKLFPIAVAIIIIAIVGIAGTTAVLVLKNIRSFSIFYLCGCRWKDCIRIMLADIGIIVLSALLLTVAAIACLVSLNMEYLIGMDIGLSNVLITAAVVVVIVLFSVMLPVSILKSKTPAESLGEVN